MVEEEYPDILIQLLYLQPNGVSTDSNIWKNSFEYFNNLKGEVPLEVRELIDYFIDGRTFFIGGYTTSEYPYAYLFNDELKLLRKDMEKNWGNYDDKDKFGQDFKGWIDNIIKAEKDLFFAQE